MIITALAKLGATHRITLIAEYADAGTVRVTVMLVAKNDKAPLIQPIQVEGPIAEVEAHLAEHLTPTVDKVAELTSNLAAVEASVEKAKADAAKKPAPAAAPAKPTPPKPGSKGKPAPSKGGKPAPVPPADEPPEAPEDAEPSADATTPALTPAWKGVATAETPADADAPADLSDLFPED